MLGNHTLFHHAKFIDGDDGKNLKIIFDNPVCV